MENKTKKSIASFPSLIETIKLNTTTSKYEANILFSSSSAIVGASGAVIDESGKYLFITSFPDKSIAVCTKNN